MNFNHDTGSVDTIQTIDTTVLPPLGGTVGVLKLTGTGGLAVQVGTTAQRPAVANVIRRNTDLAIFEGTADGTSWVDLTKQGTVTSIAVAGSTGISTSGGPVTVAGTITLTLSTELVGLSGLSTNGIVARTGAGTYSNRTITGTASNIAVANGDGVGGNPTINLISTITAGGPIGSGTTVPAITYDAFGRLTAVTSTAITFPVTSVFGRTGVVVATKGDYVLNTLGDVVISSPANGNVLTYNGTNWVNAAGTSGTVTSVAATGSTGLTVGGSPITTSGTLTFTLSTELQGLSGLSTTGIIARTGAGTYSPRTLTGTAGNIVITNGDGVAGAPTFNLATVTAGSTGTTFQKFSTDTFGRVNNVTAVTTSDIRALVDTVYLQLTGGSVSGNITMTGGATVTGLPTPSNPSDASPKSYVDAAVTGLSWKQSVKAATTTAGTLASSFANGSTIDGVTLVTGDRILIKNQATASENGIYVVNASGAPTRASDSTTSQQLMNESVFIDQGTVNSDTGWVQTTNQPITVGTTGLVYSQFSGSGTYTAGNGLTLTGNIFSLSSPVSTTNGGTGLSTIGAANTILGVNAAGTALEYKTPTGGTGISIVNTAGVLTINNTGVTSVALALPSIFTVTGSPVTTTGTLTGTLAAQAANTVFAGPTTGSTAPTFRALVPADLPFKLYAENATTYVAPTATGANAQAQGSGASATLYGSQTNANGIFATGGDAQMVFFVMRNITTDATATELFLDGTSATQRAVLPNNSVWTYEIIVSARRTDATGGAAGYRFEGVIVKDTTAASTASIGFPSKSVLGETQAIWDVSLSADTTNGSMKLLVSGESAKTIRWVASVKISQVTN